MDEASTWLVAPPASPRRAAPAQGGARAGSRRLHALVAVTLLLALPVWLPGAARLPAASAAASSVARLAPVSGVEGRVSQQPIDGRAPGGVAAAAFPAPAVRVPVVVAPPVAHAPRAASTALPTGSLLQRDLAPPRATPAAAGLSLTTYWDRLRQLEYLPAILHTQPLAPSERSDQLFGVADALSAGDATAPIMRGMGAAVDRIEFRWDQLEPAPGVYDFSALDNALAMNDQLGFAVLAVVDGTPPWAAADSASPGNAPPLGLDQPAYRGGVANPANPWAGFLATLAAHYGSRVAAWEVWNEPNSPAFWRGTPAQYARLLAVARAVLAQQAPRATLMVGGMVGDDGAFLRAVIAALCPVGSCAGRFPDAIAWHVYDNPADIPRLAELTRRLLQPRGLTPQVWITEANVPVDDPQAPADAVVGPDAVSPERQAAFVVQAYALARLDGVHTLVMYRAADVDDQGHYWGLLRGDGSARPALLAYRTAARWLGRTRALGLGSPQPGVTVARFCGAGRRVDVVWNDAARPVTLPIPAGAAPADQVEATGAMRSVTPDQGAWRLTLPPATAPTSSTVALGLPILLVSLGDCA